MEEAQKNVYNVTFENGESINVIAISFDEAMKKGRANASKDQGEIEGIVLKARIDIN